MDGAGLRTPSPGRAPTHLRTALPPLPPLTPNSPHGPLAPAKLDSVSPRGTHSLPTLTFASDNLPSKKTLPIYQSPAQILRCAKCSLPTQLCSAHSRPCPPPSAHNTLRGCVPHTQTVLRLPHPAHHVRHGAGSAVTAQGVFASRCPRPGP